MATATIPREIPAAPDGAWHAGIVAEIDIDAIDVGTNVRADVGDVAELADSIKIHGILQPLRVRAVGGRWELVYGQRRLAAARIAGVDRVPALIDEDLLPDSGQRATTQLVENLQRRDLNPLEEARALRAILDADPALTQVELAKRIGRSAPFVSNALRILELDKKVLPLVESGKLSGAHAKALAGLKGKAQRDYAETAVRSDVSAHALEQMVRDFHERQKREADEVRALEGWAEITEQQLLEQGADKKASTLTTLDGYSWNSQRELAALKARGWKVKPDSWSRGKQCDCSAFGVGVTWDKATRVTRRCIVRAHYDAKLKAEGRRESVSWEERSREYARQEAKKKALQEGIAPRLVEAFKGLPADIARILLWSVMDYGLNDWVRDHKGDRKKPDAWAELVEQSAEDLATEITRHVLRDVDSRYNVKLDLDAIAAAFGVELPAEQPATGGRR